MNFKALSQLIAIARTLQDFNLAFEKEFDLSLTQWLVLATLKDLPGCTALALSKALQMQPSSLTQILKRLEKKHLIVITNDSRDSRKKILLLSREGKKQHDALTPEIKLSFGHLNFRAISEIHQSLITQRHKEKNPETTSANKKQEKTDAHSRF
jgi:DNA-binding MarR family transcriptional regulator